MSAGDAFVIVNETFVYESGGFDTFSHLNENLELCYTKVNKLFDNCNSFSESRMRLKDGDITNCIYDRNAPKAVEMTIAKIEKALGITNLKIKK